MTSTKPALLKLPVLPNCPLSNPDQSELYGPIQLRTNHAIGFTENESFDPKLVVYDENYQVNQALSPTFFSFVQSMCDMLKQHFPPNAKIVEVSCGKGYFIDLLEKNGFSNIVGYDKTYEGTRTNIHKEYLKFDKPIDADVIIIRHALDYIARPHEFLKSLQQITHKNCCIYIEFPSFDWIRKHQTFFDITYERINYFTLKSLRVLFANNVVSSGITFGDQTAYVIAKLGSLSDDFAKHYESGEWVYEDFELLFPNLLNHLNNISSQITPNRKFYIWGASTKGCLFLYHSKLKNMIWQSVPFAIDINPGVVGKYLPGTKIPIRSKTDFFAAARSQDLLCVANPIYVQEIKKELETHNLGAMEVISL